MNLPNLYTALIKDVPEAKVPGLAVVKGVCGDLCWVPDGETAVPWAVPDEWAELLITAHWTKLISEKMPSMFFLPGENTVQLNDYSIGWQFVGPTYPEALAAAARKLYTEKTT